MRRAITSPGLGIIVCVVVIGAYNALLFNRYLPMCEGWHSVYAHYILNGAVPYRDFHFFLPPLYPLMVAAFTGIFGPDLIFLRIFGIAVIISLTITLFLLFLRLFPAYIACTASIVSVMYYQSCVVHITYDYLTFVTLFAVLGTFLICRYYDYDYHSLKSKEGLVAAAFLFLAGLLGAAAFLIKQSGGLFVVAFPFLAVAAVGYAKGGWQKSLRSIAIYSLGVLTPMLTLLIWLVSNGLLSSFWSQAIVGASSSKGGLAAILFAWIPRLFNTESDLILASVVLAIITLRIHCLPEGFMLRRLRSGYHAEHQLPKPRTVVVFSLILVAFMLCILLPFWGINLSYKIAENDQLTFIFNRVLVIFGSAASMVLFFVFFHKILRERRTSNYDVFIILTASLGLIWGCGTAAGISEVALILSTGLLIGIALNARSRFNILRIATLVLCVLMVLYMTSFKYINPYNWWGLDQPDIRTTSTRLQVKYLHGFVVSEQTARIFSEVTSIVERNTNPGDSIYTFPNIPIFYLLTDRYPDTFGIVSWFDVEPDRYAASDALRIRELPPKVIIYLDVPEFVWDSHEDLFRGGSMSGQRQIAGAVSALASSGAYKLEATYEVPDGYKLSVWTRLPD